MSFSHLISRASYAHKSLINRAQAHYPRVLALAPDILRIPIDDILVGDINGVSSYSWYEKTGDLGRIDQPILKSPYYELYAKLSAPNTSEAALRKSRYFKMMLLAVEKFGHYGRLNTEDSLLELMRQYIDLFGPNGPTGRSTEAGPRENRSHSWPGTFVTLRAIPDASVYELIDGHHRVAAAAAAGSSHVYAYVLTTQLSAIQRLLYSVSMTKKKELYQPIKSRAVSNWPVVRNCVERYDLMRSCLSEEEVEVRGAKVVDLACSYGYFVHRYKEDGARALGVEVDRNAVVIGRHQYGLVDQDIVVEPLQGFLKKDVSYDVVCCLSILHHFGLGMDFGGGGISVIDVIRGLSRITKRVLFLDSGQNTEQWFARKLPDWSAEYIESAVLDGSDFKRSRRLGVDSDGVGRYEGNYGRQLFAFFK